MLHKYKVSASHGRFERSFYHASTEMDNILCVGVCVDVVMFILVILTFVAPVTYSRELKSEHGAKSTKRK